MTNPATDLWLLSCPLIILIVVASLLYWRLKTRTPWRWFWAGAALWAAGVALKGAAVQVLYAPVLPRLEALLPRWAYLVLASLDSGLLTGIFEIGTTLVAALIWKSLARDSSRAAAIGLGAGGLEAVLVGIAVLFYALALQYDSTTRAEHASAWGGTAFAWLINPVERLSGMIVHTSSRMLALLSVAKGKRSFFWYGFLLLAGGDAVAELFVASGKLEQVSVWWFELSILPFTLASVPIILWCLRHWPSAADDKPAGLPITGETA